MKNPTCECGNPAIVRCAGCGRYLCEACRDEHEAEVAKAMEAADKLTGKGIYSPAEKWERHEQGLDYNDPIII